MRGAGALLSSRGIEGAVWIGNSIGGHVALHAGVHGETSFSGLVLVNATGAHTRGELDPFLNEPGALRARAGVARDASLFEAALPLLFANLESAGARRFALQSAQASGREGSAKRALAAIRAVSSSRDGSLLARLGDVRVPTLVVWGEGDRLLDRENATRLTTIPGARLEWMPASGHMPQIETPIEFHRVVAPFLASIDRS